MNRPVNYCAFCVKEPCEDTNFGVNTTKDYCCYNLIKLFQANDSTFPFVDTHDKTYDVRDDSDLETTLKQKIRYIKTIVLLLYFQRLKMVVL